MSSAKIDLFREHREAYVMAKTPTESRGTGALAQRERHRYSGSPEFQRKLGALYGCAYTIKVAQKAKGRAFKVGVMEGLWWIGEREMLDPGTPRKDWEIYLSDPRRVPPERLRTILRHRVS